MLAAAAAAAFTRPPKRYKHMDLIDLEHKIMEAEDAGAKVKLIATDGVFSMDGEVSAA
jgi:glycine C-acetyltransferase